jgi:hypothetical protein
MRRPLLIAILLCLSIPAPPAIAEPPSAEGEIRVALERWTSDFNAGQSDKVCGLFAGDLLADVRGLPSAILTPSVGCYAGHSLIPSALIPMLSA